MQQSITLTRAGDWSFKLHTGTPADLACWLDQRGYVRRTVKNSNLEAERLDKGPLHNRAVIIAFASGAVLVQGSTGPRQEAVDTLATLVCDEMRPGEQLELFGGTVEEIAPSAESAVRN
jgi:hypothetical protein